MANMSDYLENKLIDHIFRATAFTMPSAITIALLTTLAGDSDTGGTIVEVSGGSYARVSVPPSTANWLSTNGLASGASSGTGGATNNVAAITFPVATANWGTIVGVAILDSITLGAGNVLFYGPLAINKTVNTNDTFQFAANQLSIQIDN